MKKLLLCLSVSGLVFVAPAYAAEPLDISLGGYFKGYMNYTDQDNAPGVGVDETGILRRTEIHFDGETKLENGLIVGVHVEGLADAGSGFDIDESHAYFAGDWGLVNLGAKDGAAFLLQVAAPSADKDIDGVRQQIQPVNLSAFGVGVGETDYDQNISAKSDKITYITPKFSGLQVGFSYTPEVEASRGGNGNSLDGDDTAANSDVVDGAVKYETEFSGLKITTGAGYTRAVRETGPGEDRQAWNAGMSVKIKNFGIGAAYQNDDEGSDDDDVSYSVVGVDYKMGDYLFGASYYRKNDDVGTEVDTDRITAGVNYKLAPGISFRSSVSRLESDVTGGDEFKATSFVLGTIIDF